MESDDFMTDVNHDHGAPTVAPSDKPPSEANSSDSHIVLEPEATATSPENALESTTSLQPMPCDYDMPDAEESAGAQDAPPALDGGEHTGVGKTIHAEMHHVDEFMVQPISAALKPPPSFTTTLRDPAIKCNCPPGTLRKPKEMVHTGSRDGQLTWMHLPCKPYLGDMSEERVARIREKMQIATANTEVLDTRAQMQNTLLAIMGSNPTEEQKRKVSNLTSKYLCDGPCQGSKDTKDYFCCKKCWTWQHRTCMLYGDEGDSGGPVCNRCYINYISVQKEMVAWQKVRLLSAAKAAFKFVQNPANSQDKWRVTWCKKFLARLFYHNRDGLAKFVIARRRVQWLVENRHQLTLDGVPPTQNGPPPDPNASDGLALSLRAPTSKTAGKRPATRGKIKREDTPEQTNLGDQMDLDTPDKANDNSIVEHDSDTIVVRPRNRSYRPVAIRKSAVRPNIKPKPTIKAPPISKPTIRKVRSTSKAKTKKEESAESSESESPLPGQRGSKKHPTRGSRQSTRKAKRPATYQEPQLSEDEDEDEDDVEEDEDKGPTPTRTANDGNEQDENDVEDQDNVAETQIACTCIGGVAKNEQTFECGECGKLSHLKCNRDPLGVPVCLFCNPQPAQPMSRLPHRSASQLTSMHPPSNPRRETTTTPAPKSSFTPAPKEGSTPAPSSEPQPLSEAMRQEVRQICPEYLWKTWVDVPLSEGSETKQLYHSNDPAPADWLAEIESRLVDMLEAAGEEMTRNFLDPALLQTPRKKEGIVKALRAMSLEVLYRGAYKGKGTKVLGVLAEVLGFADKGKFWNGQK